MKTITGGVRIKGYDNSLLFHERRKIPQAKSEIERCWAESSTIIIAQLARPRHSTTDRPSFQIVFFDEYAAELLAFIDPDGMPDR